MRFSENSFGSNAVELCRHDEVVLVQSFDFLGTQRDCCVAPAKTDIGVVPLFLGECRRALDKSEGFTEVLEAVGSLDPLCLIEQLPIRRLLVITGSLLSG